MSGTIGTSWVTRNGTMYRTIKLDDGRETCLSGGQSVEMICPKDVEQIIYPTERDTDAER